MATAVAATADAKAAAYAIAAAPCYIRRCYDDLVTYALIVIAAQLGEHGEWCKQTLFELATRVPLMIRVPGDVASASRGKTARALVELVDMYKTLADLFGLHTETGVEGRSFAPLFSNPEMSHSVRTFDSC